MVLSTVSSSSLLGYAGCCCAVLEVQLDGDHPDDLVVAAEEDEEAAETEKSSLGRGESEIRD